MEMEIQRGGLTNLDNFMTGSAFCTLYGVLVMKNIRRRPCRYESDDKYPSSDGQFWHGNRSPNMWIDGVFMMQMFLIRCAQYVGEADYCYDVACRNIIAAAATCNVRWVDIACLDHRTGKSSVGR